MLLSPPPSLSIDRIDRIVARALSRRDRESRGRAEWTELLPYPEASNG